MKLFYITILVTLLTTQSFCQCFNTEGEYKEYYKKNISTLDPIEGIWSISVTSKAYKSNQLGATDNNSQAAIAAVIIKDDYYLECFIDGSYKSTETKFYNTATSGVYLYNQYFKNSYSTAKATAVLTEKGLLEYTYEVPAAEMKNLQGSNYDPDISLIIEEKWIKIFPTDNEYKFAVPSSGTGFALSSDGLIVTNHHVIQDATSIKIRGVKGDFSKSFKAKVITDDKNNDLAIIKIDDLTFSSLGTIPYVISNKPSDVGSSVFCLGYPLRATMGEEVKLTNGIVSSKSGFQGDITTYQITAPVQPGNSGGPLFDDKGNLIGIINAKYRGAENVTYAIKTSYLLNLIDILPTTPKLQSTNFLSEKPLSEQVKVIKNFTYIIEVN